MHPLTTMHVSRNPNTTHRCSGERSDLEKRLEILRKEQELIEEEEEAQLAASEVVLPDEAVGQALPGSAAQMTAAAAAAAVVREAAASTYAGRRGCMARAVGAGVEPGTCAVYGTGCLLMYIDVY